MRRRRSQVVPYRQPWGVWVKADPLRCTTTYSAPDKGFHERIPHSWLRKHGYFFKAALDPWAARGALLHYIGERRLRQRALARLKENPCQL